MDTGGSPLSEEEKKRREQIVAEREREERARARADFRERLVAELRRLFSYLLVIALVVFVCLHWAQIRSFVSHQASRLDVHLGPHVVVPQIYATNYEQQVNEAGSVK